MLFTLLLLIPAAAVNVQKHLRSGAYAAGRLQADFPFYHSTEEGSVALRDVCPGQAAGTRIQNKVNLVNIQESTSELSN